jgi:hypothetical protein
MKLLPLAFAATLACAGPARADLHACDHRSDFDLRIEPTSLAFHRDAGTPMTIELHRDRLVVDGRDVALSAADRARLRRYEASVRALVPEVKAIALDAVAIAADAVTQVATAFAGDERPQSIARVRELSAQMIERIERSDDSRQWSEREVEAMVAEFSGELVPMIVGDVASVALQAAFSGDTTAVEKLEQRADAMQRELERRIEKRAGELEVRAEALCPRIAQLAALEDELELRLAGDRPLDLLRTE